MVAVPRPPKKDATSDLEAPLQERPKGKKQCGNCGEYGHNRRNCSKPESTTPFKPKRTNTSSNKRASKASKEIPRKQKVKAYGAVWSVPFSMGKNLVDDEGLQNLIPLTEEEKAEAGEALCVLEEAYAPFLAPYTPAIAAVGILGTQMGARLVLILEYRNRMLEASLAGEINAGTNGASVLTPDPPQPSA